MLEAQTYPDQKSAAQSLLEAEIQRVFQKQQIKARSLRQSTAAERIEKIKKLRDAVIYHKEDFAKAGFADFKKPAAEVELTEVMPIVAEANFTIKHLKKWMKAKKVSTPLALIGTSSWVQYEPRGVCLIISPWNYPFNLTFCPLVSAIAGGNTVILKTSEMTPNASALMVKIIRSIFNEDEVAIFEGEVNVSTALLAQPFDHIFFTGAPSIGKVVMSAAAKHLASVTLELGGKSPTIIDETANLDQAARYAMWGKYTNNGQTCIAPDHIYVHESVKSAFIVAAKNVLEKTYGDKPEKSPDLARMVNERHFGRVNKLLEDAKQKGAVIEYGGETNAENNYIAPTFLSNVSADSEIMREEIFGPLLPIISYKNLSEVTDQINSQPKPLALYIFSKNKNNTEFLLKNTSAGGTCINHNVLHFLQHYLPFGGVNNSGIGSAHGHYGFLAFSHERAVLQEKLSTIKFFFPPYTPTVRKLIGLALKWFV